MKTTSGANPLAGRLQEDGFAILPGLYEPAEIAALLQCIEGAPASGPNFRRSQAVFAIRNLLGEVPELGPLLDTAALRALLTQLFPEGCQLVKAIYFDKPALSNWLVAWHQDLMINVDGRVELPGFGPWTSKPEGTSVQPPVAVLENMCTIRIHLDDCDASNGGLKVVAGTHQHGVLPPATLPALTPAAVVCAVPAGGVLLMRPLLLHASNRSTSARPRRVIHLEFASTELPGGLQWRERRPWLEAEKQR
ncbi:phytanoyl-CoA dioxygenase family protein [Hymenobacter sp. BT664]|uniref:Phytanoyl-CoA dioxygenase family protein n=1 Tax=Hymenobacter montanus TaxID=2771359 RepID=A0A927GIY3_9BACT|nr:phytanoyl-CoA dioxygenase family protein [Hymenobacter montanus]MBD2767907.1 phytanoyl-CoA dioxygenase family protein [Hymenobacter montanus]